MASRDDNTANFFHNSEYDEAYWDQYLAARPKYNTCGFYDKIFRYHDAHSAAYDTAHDIATGPGQVATVLATRFRHVVASDANEAHVGICRHRNSSLAKTTDGDGYAGSEDGSPRMTFLVASRLRNAVLAKTTDGDRDDSENCDDSDDDGSPRMTFLVAPGESVAASVPRASADAVFLGEGLALMDPTAAFAGFCRMLRPGGTMAVWFYGRPTFADGPEKARCQEIYGRIATKRFGGFIKGGGGGPEKTAGWKRATDMLASWFDNVVFPKEDWKDVERHKWNTGGKMCFYDDEACDFPVETSSVISEDEKVVESTDDSLWAESWNVAEVRRFLEVNLPSFHEAEDEDPEVEAWYDELEAAMGGKDTKRKIVWPVVLLLATRR